MRDYRKFFIQPPRRRIFFEFDFPHSQRLTLPSFLVAFAFVIALMLLFAVAMYSHK